MDFNEATKSTCVAAINTILDDDLLERVFAYLPLESLVRAGSVCHKWRHITSSKRFLLKVAHKPWYFILHRPYDESTGVRTNFAHAYDLVLHKWHCIDLSVLEEYKRLDSSFGLVCFLRNDEIYVCNPLTGQLKSLQEPPGFRDPAYYHIKVKILVNQKSHDYYVLLLKWKHAHYDCRQWDLSLQVYDSKTMEWTTSRTDALTGWVQGSQCVICDGFLYFLINYNTDGEGLPPRNEQRLVAYEFSSVLSSHGALVRSCIQLPCIEVFEPINLQEKLAVVGRGSIKESDKTGHSIELGIWLLEGKEWQFISGMPMSPEWLQGLDLYGCSGIDDHIFIHGVKSISELLVFDMNLKQWSWSQKWPQSDRPGLFRGFFLQPRLDISP